MASGNQRVTTTVRFDLAPKPAATERAEPVTALTPEQHRLHAAELLQEGLSHTVAMDRPTAILTGGQPGSGKSRIVEDAKAQLDGRGGAIVIDPDEIRPTLPYMKERIARGDLEIPNEANVDAGTIAYQMVQLAKQERRNVVIDGTLQNTRRALDLAGEMKAAGYDVQFHGMAIYPDLSHARTYTRREEQIAKSPTRFGRGVSDEFHDQAVEGYRNTIEAFQTKSAVNSMTFYGPEGKMVETRFENGQWVPNISMKEQIEQAHARADLKSMMAATDAWWAAGRDMRHRGAPEEEIAKVGSFAHLAALRERQLRATTVRASITFPDKAPTSAQAPEPEVPAPTRHDLTNEDCRSLAALVHAGIQRAGRDADHAIMNVEWAQGQAYLDIRTPKERGFDRFTLPQHERIEKALAGILREGTLEVDYADNPARVTGMEPRTLDAKARALGLEARDFGISMETRAPEREQVQAKGGAIAAMMAARGRQI